MQHCTYPITVYSTVNIILIILFILAEKKFAGVLNLLGLYATGYLQASIYLSDQAPFILPPLPPFPLTPFSSSFFLPFPILPYTWYTKVVRDKNNVHFVISYTSLRLLWTIRPCSIVPLTANSWNGYSMFNGQKY